VAIVEAGNFTRFRIGETLDASAGSLLARLGVPMKAGSDAALASHGIASVWASSSVQKRPSIVNPHGQGWRLNRREFDRALFQHAGAEGATLFSNSRIKRAERHAGRWEFSMIREGREFRGTTPMIVEATGRTGRSHFASSGSRLWFDRLVGIAILGDCRASFSPVLGGVALVEAAPAGWWYSVLLPGNQTLVVFFTDGDLLPHGRPKIADFLNSQLPGSEHTGARCPFLEERLSLCRWQVFDARSSIRKIALSEGWVAAGDALMALDPLSGQGIVAALNSGTEIAEWLLDGQFGSGTIPVWMEAATARFNDYLDQRRRIYGQEQRWLTSRFWQRRQASEPA
jgi:2-polyprenyl-6-methoxyphenol hydroxylase-like FAD-dependent oxidoreductase